MQNANLKLQSASGVRQIYIFHFEIYNFQYESFLCRIALNSF